MIIKDLWRAPGPSTWDLHALERLAERRRAIEAVEPVDEQQASVRTHLLATLDLMEESLCEEGRHAPVVQQGLQVLDAFEPQLANTDPGRRRRHRQRRHSQRRHSARRPSTARARRAPRSTRTAKRPKETRS